MSKGAKRAVVVSVILIAAGVACLITGFATGGLNSINWGENGFQIIYGNSGAERVSEDFDSFDVIDMDLDAYEIYFVEANGYSVNVDYDQRFGAPEISLDDGKLTVRELARTDGRGGRWRNIANRAFFGNGMFSWVTPFNWTMRVPVITVAYPKNKTFDSVAIKSAAASVDIRGLDAKYLTVSCDAGNLYYADGKTDNIKINMAMGNCNLQGVNGGNAEFSLDAGALSANRFSCENLRAGLNMGSADISGELKGNIYVDTNMGAMTISTSLPESDYSYSVRANMGGVEINGRDIDSGSLDSKNPDAMNHIEASASMGNVTINFSR